MERYEKYKASGVEWIGEIPEGWRIWGQGLISDYERALDRQTPAGKSSGTEGVLPRPGKSPGF